jgi:hypothetical protein
MSDVEQALITLIDYTKSTAGSSKQHELFLSLQTRLLNERTSKKLAATAQPSLMSQSGWELREQGEPARQQHQRSQQHGRGAFGAQFLPASSSIGSYTAQGAVGGAVQQRGWGWRGRPFKAGGRLFYGHLTRFRCTRYKLSALTGVIRISLALGSPKGGSNAERGRTRAPVAGVPLVRRSLARLLLYQPKVLRIANEVAAAVPVIR